MSTIKLIILVVILGLSLSLFPGCESCDDCGPLQSEPTLLFKFFNRDSLETIEAVISSKEAVRDSIVNGIESTDSLKEVIDKFKNDLILTSDPIFEDTIIVLQMKSDSLLDVFKQLSDAKTSIESTINDLEDQLTLVNSGLTKVDSIISVADGNGIVLSSDSLDSFNIPLAVNSDNSSYRFIIGGKSFELTLNYIRSFVEDEKSRIVVLISNITLVDHNFKEVEISCTDCSNKNTSVTAYF
ncbi:MAG: hypothetical protein RJQ09_14420 [Cyclobacteriaceae bacterium]